MTYRKRRQRLISIHLNWQNIFGAKHLQCPNPDNHVNGDCHPSAFVYPDGIHCFGCGWRTTDLAEACEIFFGWSRKHTARWAYNYMATHPPRPEKTVQIKPIPLGAVDIWVNARTSRDTEYLLHKYSVSPDILDIAKIGYIPDRAFTIPHLGLDGRVWAIKFRRDDRESDKPPKYWSFENRGYHYIYPAFAVHHYTKQKTPQRIVLCEGEFDCLAALSHDIPAIAVPSGSATNLTQWAWFWQWMGDNGIILYLGYDMDDAGYAASQRAFTYLSKNHPGLLTIRLEWEGGKDIAEQLSEGGKII